MYISKYTPILVSYNPAWYTQHIPILPLHCQSCHHHLPRIITNLGQWVKYKQVFLYTFTFLGDVMVDKCDE